MSHTCKALILHCIDFRLGAAIKNYLEGLSLLGEADIVSVAGAVKNLVSPALPTDAEFVLRQIDLSKRLHGIAEVILINHTDCGAYGGRQAFRSDEEEYEKHSSDLKKAKEMILAQFPGLEIRTILAKIPAKNRPDWAIFD